MEKIYNIVSKKLAKKELSSKESLQLENWLKLSDNQSVYKDLEDVWKLTGKLDYKISIDIDAEWDSFKSALNTNKKSKTKKITFRYVSIAASVVLLLGLFGLSHFGKSDLVKYTAENTHKIIKLPDSSQVWLNRNSSLVLAKKFNKKTRTVSLNGEAFFEIEKNANKPFIINANGTATEVVGTSFDLRAYPNEPSVELQVTSGKVKFGEEKANRLMVEKNNSAYFDVNTQQITKLNTINKNLVSWRTKKLSFDNEKITEVVIAFERYLNKKIVIPQNSKDLRFTGNFNAPSETDVADLLSVAFNWNYKIDSNKIEFFSKK